MDSAVSNISNFLKSLPSGLTLVAVTKTVPLDIIRDVYQSGHKTFGENKVQELISKKNCLPEDIEWHMIGHLQSNKVKFIAPFIDMIHSVDSLKILSQINKEAGKNNRIIKCLLQMYIASEESKFGLSLEEAESILSSEEYKSFENISINGLMAMASFTSDLNQIRKEFKMLTHYFNHLKNKYFPHSENFKEKSIGMTNDYKIAIEEGATIIRIGSLIFGDRIKDN